MGATSENDANPHKPSLEIKGVSFPLALRPLKGMVGAER